MKQPSLPSLSPHLNDTWKLPLPMKHTPSPASPTLDSHLEAAQRVPSEAQRRVWRLFDFEIRLSIQIHGFDVAGALLVLSSHEDQVCACAAGARQTVRHKARVTGSHQHWQRGERREGAAQDATTGGQEVRPTRTSTCVSMPSSFAAVVLVDLHHLPQMYAGLPCPHSHTSPHLQGRSRPCRPALSVPHGCPAIAASQTGQ